MVNDEYADKGLWEFALGWFLLGNNFFGIFALFAKYQEEGNPANLLLTLLCVVGTMAGIGLVKSNKSLFRKK